jgi:hypothetical protein
MVVARIRKKLARTARPLARARLMFKRTKARPGRREMENSIAGLPGALVPAQLVVLMLLVFGGVLLAGLIGPRERCAAALWPNLLRRMLASCLMLLLIGISLVAIFPPH